MSGILCSVPLVDVRGSLVDVRACGGISCAQMSGILLLFACYSLVSDCL
jgi:hypothetical protein